MNLAILEKLTLLSTHVFGGRRDVPSLILFFFFALLLIGKIRTEPNFGPQRKQKLETKSKLGWGWRHLIARNSLVSRERQFLT